MKQSTCGAVFCQPSGNELKHDMYNSRRLNVSDSNQVRGWRSTGVRGQRFLFIATINKLRMERDFETVPPIQWLNINSPVTCI